MKKLTTFCAEGVCTRVLVNARNEAQVRKYMNRKYHKMAWFICPVNDLTVREWARRGHKPVTLPATQEGK